MTTALIIAIILAVCVVFALGVYHGQHYGREQREDLAEQLGRAEAALDDLSSEQAQAREKWADWVEGHVFVGSYTDRYDEEGL